LPKTDKRRLQISSNPSQYENLEIFIREQDLFQDLIVNTTIPTLVVDVTNRSLEEQVEQIADWLETTGGLNPAESSPNPEFKLCAPLNAKEADPLVRSGLMPAA